VSADEVRLATVEDAPAIAEVMIASWVATYRGIMPDTVLARQTVEGATTRWTERLTAAADPESARTWVVTSDGGVRGYAVTAEANDHFRPPPGGAGEIDSLYLAPEAIGRGLGRTLHAEITADLWMRGFAPLILWAFEANDHARRFYERAGWVHDLDHHWVLDEQPIPIVRYRLDAAVDG
jgi:GNAT superfamily N-acetyltransferase